MEGSFDIDSAEQLVMCDFFPGTLEAELVTGEPELVTGTELELVCEQGDEEPEFPTISVDKSECAQDNDSRSVPESVTESVTVSGQSNIQMTQRPRRKSAVQCQSRIREILAWENLPKNAPELLEAASCIDMEMRRERKNMSATEIGEISDVSETRSDEGREEDNYSAMGSSEELSGSSDEESDEYESSFIDEDDECSLAGSEESYAPPPKRLRRVLFNDSE